METKFSFHRRSTYRYHHIVFLSMEISLTPEDGDRGDMEEEYSIPADVEDIRRACDHSMHAFFSLPPFFLSLVLTQTNAPTVK
jgi:hypothetical protein